MKVKRELKFTEGLVFESLKFARWFFLIGAVFSFYTKSESFWMYAFPTVGTMLTVVFTAFQVKETKQNLTKIKANPHYDLQKEIFSSEELKDIFSNIKEDDLSG